MNSEIDRTQGKVASLVMADLQPATGTLQLPAILDIQAASPLKEAFLARRGEDLVVDGAEVQRLGAQCLQILLAVRAAWAADGRNLTLENSSAHFISALELLGVAPETLIYRTELGS
jgi:chemotaxis protein CheX